MMSAGNFRSTSAAARPLGVEIQAAERHLDEGFASGFIGPEMLRAETAAIAELQGKAASSSASRPPSFGDSSRSARATSRLSRSATPRALSASAMPGSVPIPLASVHVRCGLASCIARPANSEPRPLVIAMAANRMPINVPLRPTPFK
jgi:hypothetical protein